MRGYEKNWRHFMPATVNEPFRLRSWFYWLWGIICRRQSGVRVQYEQEADLAELFGDRMASNYDTEK